MFEELEKLIDFIIGEYSKISEEWKKSPLFDSINQKDKLVRDINDDNNILNTILNYRRFINEWNIELDPALKYLDLVSDVNSRVKAQNSIEYKISNYMSEKHEFGKVPLNKCFNDLYGIRIIFDESIKFEDIKKFIDEKYNRALKCYDASKGDYVATHIYFKSGNYCFQWELQIWDKEHEESNLISHDKYKQDYTKWETENKGR